MTLVRNHLLLPEIATRRDLDDPSTVAGVAAAVGDVDVLDLLHALAEADAAATGPAAWSDWKKALIDDLVARTRAVLAGTPRAEEIHVTAAQARLLAEAVRVTTEGGVAVLLDHDEAATTATVTVAAPDRTGLLSTVAGVLSLHRLQVRGAQVDTVTAPDGGRRAVQVWTVSPAYGDPPPVERLREDVRPARSTARSTSRPGSTPASRPTRRRRAPHRRGSTSCPGRASGRPCSRCARTTQPALLLHRVDPRHRGRRRHHQRRPCRHPRLRGGGRLLPGRPGRQRPQRAAGRHRARHGAGRELSRT